MNGDKNHNDSSTETFNSATNNLGENALPVPADLIPSSSPLENLKNKSNLFLQLSGERRIIRNVNESYLHSDPTMQDKLGVLVVKWIMLHLIETNGGWLKNMGYHNKTNFMQVANDTLFSDDGPLNS